MTNTLAYYAAEFLMAVKVLKHRPGGQMLSNVFGLFYEFVQ
jgi:hypothetical protein